MASRKLAGSVSVEVATLADEFIWILDDTASFIGWPRAERDRALHPGAVAAVRGRVGALRPRARVLVGRARPPGRRGVPEVADRPRVLRLLRREPVSYRHGHRARRARLDARPYRPDRRERALCRARLRRAPFVLGAERHVRVEPRDHVRVRRRRRDRAVRSQLPQVHRAGSRDHGRHPGVPEPDAQSLRHHRSDSRRSASSRRRSRRASPTTRWRRPRVKNAPSTRCSRTARTTACATTRPTRKRGSRRASTASISTKRGTATRASIRCTAIATRCAAVPETHPKDGPTVFATHSTHKLLGRAVADLVHPHPRRPRRDRSRALQRSVLLAGEHFAALCAHRVERGCGRDDGRPGRAVAHAGNHRRGRRVPPRRRARAPGIPREEGLVLRTVESEEVAGPKGKRIPFHKASAELLATDPNCWVLHPGESWHGFEGLPDGWCMLDPIKFGIVCPGMRTDGQLEQAPASRPTSSPRISAATASCRRARPTTWCCSCSPWASRKASGARCSTRCSTSRSTTTATPR